MNLLWIGPWYSSDLSAQCRGAFAAALSSLGNVVATVVCGPPGSWETGGYQEIVYLPVPRNAIQKLANQFRMLAVVCRFKGDAVVLGERVSHFGLLAPLIRFVLRRRWKVVIDVRTLPIPAGEGMRSRLSALRFWTSLRLGFVGAHAWTAITHRLKAKVEERVNTRRLPVEVWESAVDAAFCESPDATPDERIVACGHEVNLLYLGSLAAGRRIDLAVRAMEGLAGEDGRFGLHIVGSGPPLDELKKLTRDMGLEDSVHFRGAVPHSQVPSVIAACQAGVLPLPDCEAWNVSSALKLFEYMAMGKPVIVSDIPAHADLLRGRDFAFFMPEFSEEGFREAARQAADLSPELRAETASKARAFVKENHTWNHRARTVHDFLESVVS